MFQGHDSLQRALNLLAGAIDVLPASGGAVEDLERPDEEEIEDLLINSETKEITEFLETPAPADLYLETPPLYRSQENFYRYFIDGSIRTYFLATGIEEDRSFPIELAQIGAAVIERDESGRACPVAVRHRLLLLLPRGPRRLIRTGRTEVGYHEAGNTFGSCRARRVPFSNDVVSARRDSMLSTEPDFEEILAQVERLSPEDRVRLIQRVAETLVTRGTSAEQRRLVYGEFRGPRMSTEEDFKIAEWHPTERDLHGP